MKTMVYVIEDKKLKKFLRRLEHMMKTWDNISWQKELEVDCLGTIYTYITVSAPTWEPMDILSIYHRDLKKSK